MMKRMVFLLAVLGTLLSGCEAPAPGGNASSAPQEGSSAQEELPNTEGESSVPLEEEPEPEPPSRPQQAGLHPLYRGPALRRGLSGL